MIATSLLKNSSYISQTHPIQPIIKSRRKKEVKLEETYIEIEEEEAYMAANLKPVFAYTVVYVKDVAKSVAFYAKAFGYDVRRLDESHRWGELQSGQTTIAFTTLHQKETDEKTGVVRTPSASDERGPVEVCFAYADVDAAYKRAVENGAVPVSVPEPKEWGQKVGYVRDIDGIVVRLGSYVKEPSTSSH